MEIFFLLKLFFEILAKNQNSYIQKNSVNINQSEIIFQIS